MSSDLLDLLGGEWADLGKTEDKTLPPAPDQECTCSRDDRSRVTHGCRALGIAPTRWDEVFGGYVDGMGRPVGCAYCFSCMSSGRTALRDPWTDALLDWRGAPCAQCWGTGYHHHG
ncbi:hypothetical protein [Microbacterium karelineae]|uniref:hypothetical protein n=1 Tax=Microbacterium karelineae TaxID=2654283 RepID=UPI0012EAEA3C|nr:hypothetical protein [Microbacterium karelineae]